MAHELDGYSYEIVGKNRLAWYRKMFEKECVYPLSEKEKEAMPKVPGLVGRIGNTLLIEDVPLYAHRF